MCGRIHDLAGAPVCALGLGGPVLGLVASRVGLRSVFLASPLVALAMVVH
jgi:hypothetical protein